jgi:hypothetical protein
MSAHPRLFKHVASARDTPPRCHCAEGAPRPICAGVQEGQFNFNIALTHITSPAFLWAMSGSGVASAAAAAITAVVAQAALGAPFTCFLQHRGSHSCSCPMPAVGSMLHVASSTDNTLVTTARATSTLISVNALFTTRDQCMSLYTTPQERLCVCHFE